MVVNAARIILFRVMRGGVGGWEGMVHGWGLIN